MARLLELPSRNTTTYLSQFCCHTIQLAIKDALKVKLGQVSVGKVLDKCRNIATLVKRSESKGGKKRISKLYYMYK